jgi:hypothetical protein
MEGWCKCPQPNTGLEGLISEVYFPYKMTAFNQHFKSFDVAPKLMEETIILAMFFVQVSNYRNRNQNEQIPTLWC